MDKKIILGNDWKSLEFYKIVELYDSVLWSAYTKDIDSLYRAYKNSSYVVFAQNNKGRLIGIARSISDDVSIHYLQDILIHPKFQKQGVGRMILNNVLSYYSHVRTHVLLTDDEEKQLIFYKSLGYSNTKELKNNLLNVFVKMKNLTLS